MEISKDDFKAKVDEQKQKLESTKSPETIQETADKCRVSLKNWVRRKRDPGLRKVIKDIDLLLRQDPATGLALMDVMAQEIFPEYSTG
jgi:hypothetical protein